MIRAPIDGFTTLKQALSGNGAQLSHGKQYDRRNGIDSNKTRQHTQKGVRHGRPSHINIPEIPKAAEAALTALQYIPKPLLVLSSLKTIMIVNEAMGRLLGLDKLEPPAQELVDDNGEQIASWEILRGRSLSQIGIDMIQDGNTVIVNWEVSNALFHYKSNKD